MNFKCPHLNNQISTILEIKNINKENLCENCQNAGPNLWICMQRKCLRVGCSEQANDHSTEHFKVNNSHCVHMNLSSQRLWCYLCEKEVFLGNDRAVVSNPFEATDAERNSDVSEDENKEFVKFQGLVGLQNLANTCYMNSALQALSNIQPLTYYFLDCADLVEHTVEQAAYRSKSGLAKSYLRLMQDIWCRSKRTKDYIAPRGILYGIRSVHPMFRGFQQHDTQEFLRCFMDQLHEELKELSFNMPLDRPLDNSIIYQNYSIGDQTINNTKNDEECSMNSQSDSASQSEAEYETCDSGVSEQSSLFDDSSVVNERLCSDQKRLPGDANNLYKSARERKNTNARQHLQKNNELNLQQNQSIYRSIISDVFDGKLLSSVQCLTCDRVSTREETFQDLSLPIPNRDFLNVLHQTHGISAQNMNSLGYGLRVAAGTGNELVKSDGWLTWMWNIFRSWLWGPSVTLHDCMASFFSADELKGDNMYSCEKCNKLRTGVKFSRILNLPEALCIHLKRFRHDLSYSSKISSYIHFPMECFDMRPYLHKDCKSNISLYNLVSVICHYGTVGGGHYTCFARNELNNKWYEYDDQHVTEVSVDTVQNCQAYVLFYRKRNPHMDLIRAEARNISDSNPSHVSDIRFYVSREWISRFNTFAEPGPINNWAILCPHGGLPPNKIDVMSKIALPISQPLWDYLYKKFGGGPVINMLFECEVCKRAADILLRRQRYELTIFTKYNDMEDSSAIYAISMPWLRKWQLFARGLTNKEPGPITNSTIAASSDSCLNPPIRNVKTGSDYAQLNTPLWKFLHSIYGGGPEIILRENLNEEIEIVDQDGDFDFSTEHKGQHSDSEQSAEHHSTEDLQSNSNNLIEEYPLSRTRSLSFENVNENTDIKVRLFDDSVTSTKKSSKPSKHFPSLKKSSNIISIRSASKKRTKQRRRNTMKTAGFFGPTGYYNFNKNEENSEGAKIDLKFQNEAIPNAFYKQSTKSFHRDKPDKSDSNVKTNKNKNLEVDRTKHLSSEECIDGNHLRSPKHKKGSNKHTSRKHGSLKSESSETEV